MHLENRALYLVFGYPYLPKGLPVTLGKPCRLKRHSARVFPEPHNQEGSGNFRKPRGETPIYLLFGYSEGSRYLLIPQLLKFKFEKGPEGGMWGERASKT